MPFKRVTTSGYSSMRRRPLMRTRRQKKLPNIKRVNFFTPRNINTGIRYAVKGVNLMKGIINSELHKHDQNNTQTLDTNAQIVLLTGTNQGDAINNRQGNSSLGKYITYNFATELQGSTPAQVRVILFVDTDNDGETPTETELLQAPSNIRSAMNTANTQRFTILYDRILTLSPNGDQLLGEKIYRTLNFHQKYRGPTGGTDFGKNNVWLYLNSTEPTDGPTVQWYSRYAFYDN